MSTQRLAIRTLFYNQKQSAQQMIVVYIHTNKKKIPVIFNNVDNFEKHYTKQMTPKTKSQY